MQFGCQALFFRILSLQLFFQLCQLLRDFCQIGIFILQQGEIFFRLCIIGFQSGYLFFKISFFRCQCAQIFFQCLTLLAVFTGQREDVVTQLLFFRIPLSQLFFQLCQFLRDVCHIGIFILQQGEIFFRLCIIGFQSGYLFFKISFFRCQCAQIFFQCLTLLAVFTGQREDVVTQLLFFRIPLSQLFFQLCQFLRNFCHIGIFGFQQRDVFI